MLNVEWYWWLFFPAITWIIWYILIEPFMPMILIALKYEPYGRPVIVYKIISFFLTLLILGYIIFF